MRKTTARRAVLAVLGLVALIGFRTDGRAWGGDLDEVLRAGKLRHLGVIYANFATEDGKGLDVELMQLFAAHLGVRYEFVGTSWQNLVPDLTGKVVKPRGEDVDVVGETAVRGDVIASGFTILPWRTKVVEFSTETFPSGVWLLSRADSALQPISATDDILKDIQEVKKQLKGMSVLGLKDSCLDPDLYLLEETGAEIELFPQDRDLNEMIPAIIARLANATLMDVPVALIALERWPGEIKVVGPLSPTQGMACAFPTTSPRLRQAFEEFFRQCKADGTYHRLVNRYYPSVSTYYPHFLEN